MESKTSLRAAPSCRDCKSPSGVVEWCNSVHEMAARGGAGAGEVGGWFPIALASPDSVSSSRTSAFCNSFLQAHGRGFATL